jgi:hypothetical protein
MYFGPIYENATISFFYLPNSRPHFLTKKANLVMDLLESKFSPQFEFEYVLRSTILDPCHEYCSHICLCLVSI